MNGDTPSNEPWGVHCSPEPGRKFLPLGSVSHRAISKGLHQATSKSPSVFTTSFVSREQPTSPSLSPLPDIYTTCPELRQFKPIMTLPEMTLHQSNYSNAANSQFVQNNQSPVLSSGIQIPNNHPNLNDQKPVRFPENSDFDPNEQILKPYELGFVPQSEWPPQTLSLWELRQMYFTRRNGAARQFDFKLYNALCITKKYPEAFPYVGAKWVSNTVMKIDAPVIASLLGIHAVQGGLFHKQGNFSRHGFQHIYLQQMGQLKDDPECADVDDYNIRLLVDTLNRFTRDGEYTEASH